jgi:hypothetical protein
MKRFGLGVFFVLVLGVSLVLTSSMAMAEKPQKKQASS